MRFSRNGKSRQSRKKVFGRGDPQWSPLFYLCRWPLETLIGNDLDKLPKCSAFTRYKATYMAKVLHFHKDASCLERMLDWAPSLVSLIDCA